MIITTSWIRVLFVYLYVSNCSSYRTITTPIRFKSLTIMNDKMGSASYFRSKAAEFGSSIDSSVLKRKRRTDRNSDESEVLGSTSSELDVVVTAESIMKLLAPVGGGQDCSRREMLRQQGIKRSFSDVQMWTHAFFLVSSYIAYCNQIYDLLLLFTIVVPLSYYYHYTYEAPSLVAKLEGSGAKLLFLYGAVQLFYAPDPNLLMIELSLCISTVLVFFLTNIYKKIYDPWHSLMHIIPAIWGGFVAAYHAPLIPL